MEYAHLVANCAVAFVDAQTRLLRDNLDWWLWRRGGGKIKIEFVLDYPAMARAVVSTSIELGRFCCHRDVGCYRVYEVNQW
jgi:hypothetical protein